MLGFVPVLLMVAAEEADALIIEIDHHRHDQAGHHQRQGFETEGNPVILPVRGVEEAEIAVAKDQQAPHQPRKGRNEGGKLPLPEGGHHQQQARQNLQGGNRYGGHAGHAGKDAEKLGKADLSGEEAAEGGPELMQENVPPALPPADLLADGGAQAGGLFVIDAGKMIPQHPPTAENRVHLDLVILGQAHGGPPAPGF